MCRFRENRPHSFSEYNTQRTYWLSCVLNRFLVHGYPSAKSEAKSKKDAQTLTAWAFSDKLVEMGQVTTNELPPRPECTVKTNETMMNEAKIGIIDQDG